VPRLDRNKMEDKQYHELDKRIEVLSRDMDKKQAEYKTDIAILAKDIAQRDAQNAQRDIRNLLAMIVVVGLGITILGLVLGLIVK